jgi:hypothetical protein
MIMNYYLDFNWFGVVAELAAAFLLIKWAIHHAYHHGDKR